MLYTQNNARVRSASYAVIPQIHVFGVFQIPEALKRVHSLVAYLYGTPNDQFGDRSKVLGRFPTKTGAWLAAKPLRDALEMQTQVSTGVPSVKALVEQYRKEKMPARLDTNRGYESWICVHVLPKWGRRPITDLQARPVELWLSSLALSPKSKVHIRGILSSLWKFAMWKRDVPTQVNPMSLVTVKDASKRRRQPRSLTVEQFRLLVSHLREPFGTMALVCICFGLRISECLALRWSDVDWLNGLLRVERGIVEQNVDDVKTDESRKSLVIADELLERLKVWKQATEFRADGDWIFASPLKLGRLPYSYTGFWRELDRAGKESGIGHIGTHTFRHSYRMWIDAVGTPVGVQQKLMRHADIRTTMNIYGDAASGDMREAHGKIVQLALRPE
jgi:integrase